MNLAANDPADRDARVEQVLADYLHAADAGAPIDQRRLIELHPDLADELRSFFANRAAMERLVEPLRPTVDTPTLAVDATTSARPGAKVRYFGDYEVLEEIARGGMGVVYKARQVNLKRTVALKMILAGQLASQQEVERFHAEAEAAAKLDHPNIVPIFEVGQHDGQHYFSMAFVEGESLAQRVGRGVLPPREAAELVRRVALAIGYAHVAGIVHRDLKPANVLLDREGQPRVTDFGLAKQVGTSDGRTVTGQVLGTPSYMPPEQAGGECGQVGPLSDVYSLGAILYCLLTGRPPFQAATPLDTLLQVMTREPVSPRQLNSDVPRDLETISLKCLEKEPARRYASAQEFANELQRYLDGRPIQARPINALARAWRWCRRNSALASTATVAAILLVVVSCVYVTSLVMKNRQLTAALRSEQVAKDEAVILRGRAEGNERQARREAERADAKAAEALDHAKRLDAKTREAEAAAEQARREELRADAETDVARRRLYAAQMNLAQAAWNDATIGRLHQLLDASRPQETGGSDLRGWEWFYWQRLSRAELLTWSGRPNRVGLSSVAFHPDGKQLAAATIHDVVLIDSHTGKTIKIIPSRKLPYTAYSQMAFAHVSYSPNGKWLAACCSGGMFSNKDMQTEYVPGETLLCDPATGEILHTFPHPGRVTGAAFSPASDRLAIGGTAQDVGPGEVMIWDVATRQEAVRLQGQVPNPYKKPEQRLKLAMHGHAVNAVAFSPDGKRLATASGDQSIKLWDLETGAELRTLRGHAAPVTSVAFRADGEQLVSGGGDRNLMLWNVETGETLNTLFGHRDGVTCVAFSSDGKRIVSASNDRTVRIWDAATGDEHATIKGHATGVRQVALSADGLLATAGYDESVKLWNVETTREAQFLKFGGLSGWSRIGIAFTSDCQSLTAAASAVRTWNLSSPEEKTFEAVGEFRHRPVFSADRKRLSASSPSHAIRVWEAETGTEICVLRGHKDFIATIEFSPDGRWLASASQDREVKLWDLADGSLKWSFTGQRGIIQGLAFSADSKLLGSAHSSLKIWNVETGEQREFMSSSPMSYTSVAFSRDGKQLATGNGNKTAHIRDVASGKVRFELRGHIGRVECVAFSPDGRRLATGGGIFDQTIKLWDTTTGQEVISLTGHPKPIAGLAFSSDGHKLASVDTDGHIRVWDATPSAKE
ncbi:MAG: serine/threonine-protein kinase [Pirellulales bacterium]